MLSLFRKRLSPSNSTIRGSTSVHSASSLDLVDLDDESSASKSKPKATEKVKLDELLQELVDHDSEIVFERPCTFGGASRYLIISRASIWIYKAKKDRTKGRRALRTIPIYECAAMLPDTPMKHTLCIRTTKSMLYVKLGSDDDVDECIAVINAQSLGPTSQRARKYYWQSKLTVHVAVTEAWDVLSTDANGLSDPFAVVRVMSRDAVSPRQRGKAKTEDIVYSTIVHERDRNPVFAEQFTFLNVHPTDHIFIELFDRDQWSKNDFLGCIRVDLARHRNRDGLHGWFPLLNAEEKQVAGSGYAHVKVAMHDATLSAGHISMTGAAFTSSRQTYLAAVSNLPTETPMYHDIPIYVATWNVGNECPPGNLATWIVRHVEPNDTLKSSVSVDGTMGDQYNGSPKSSLMENYPIAESPETSPPSSKLEDVVAESMASSSVGAEADVDPIILDSLNELKVRPTKKRFATRKASSNASNGRGPRRFENSIIDLQEQPGLYVIGAQECQYTPAKGSGAACKEDWVNTLSEHVGANYKLVEYSSLWQIRLAVFVRSDLAPHVSNVSSQKEATGIGHVLGNKGGVAISLRLFQTALCFINCHLAAHQTKHSQRNQDVRDIITKIKVGNKQTDLASQFHHVWLLGDLNYRLDYGAQAAQKSPSIHEFHEIECLVHARRFQILFGFDQLARDLQKKEILAGWAEGSYDFPPSFKVERHAGIKYNPERSPAWCDRILWKSYGDGLEQMDLKICDQVATSDHKPIASVFQCRVFHFEESKDPHRGRVELLFTELALALNSDPADPIQYHVRYRSDCFTTSVPIVQAITDAASCQAMLATATTAAEKEAIEAWMAIPQFPIIRLKHNNLARLKQHIVSVELIHVTGGIVAQGTITFHQFTTPTASVPALAALPAPAPASSSPSTPPPPSRISITLSPSSAQQHQQQGSYPSSYHAPSVSDVDEALEADAPTASPVPVPAHPVPAGGASTPIRHSLTATVPQPDHPVPRRVSHMQIRPSARGSTAEAGPLARPSLLRTDSAESQGNVTSRRSFSGAPSPRGSIRQSTTSATGVGSTHGSGSVVSGAGAGQLENFTNQQSNVQFECALSNGTTLLGNLTGVMRLSWAG